MPHYRDGTPAMAGDIVKGRGYNVKHEIIGRVLRVTPGAETCNLQVACVERGSLIYASLGDFPLLRVESTIEYCEAAAFEKIA